MLGFRVGVRVIILTFYKEATKTETMYRMPKCVPARPDLRFANKS